MLKYYFKLIRYPNLLMLILSQCLIRYFLIKPIVESNGGQMALSDFNFFLLVMITLLISGAGYIINDYFDLEGDKINKPLKLIIGHHFSVEQSRMIYFVMNLTALAAGSYLSVQLGLWQLAVIFLIIVLMLWYYSARYKRMMFWGNFVVSSLTAFSLFIVWMVEFFALRANPNLYVQNLNSIHLVNVFIYGYVFFAFITSMIREIIKDAEDVEGDMRVQCRTIPIVLGQRIARLIAIFLIVMSMGALVYAMIKLWEFNYDVLFWYVAVVLQPLHIFLIYKVYLSNTSDDFHNASTYSKVLMLAGLLSMVLISFH